MKKCYICKKEIIDNKNNIIKNKICNKCYNNFIKNIKAGKKE